MLRIYQELIHHVSALVFSCAKIAAMSAFCVYIAKANKFSKANDGRSCCCLK